MAICLALGDTEPRMAEDVYLAPTAALVGDVNIGAGASVWFGTVLRGDFGRIEVGAGSSVQDGAILHSTAEFPTLLGDGVTVGHLAMLEGCKSETAH